MGAQEEERGEGGRKGRKGVHTVSDNTDTAISELGQQTNTECFRCVHYAAWEKHLKLSVLAGFV